MQSSQRKHFSKRLMNIILNNLGHLVTLNLIILQIKILLNGFFFFLDIFFKDFICLKLTT